MPRATSSPESRILAYFKTAPLAAVAIVLGLAKEAVKDRQPKVRAKKRHRRTQAEMEAARTAEMQEVRVMAPPKAKVSHKKKSHHKAKVRPQQTKAEVESILDDLDERV